MQSARAVRPGGNLPHLLGTGCTQALAGKAPHFLDEFSFPLEFLELQEECPKASGVLAPAFLGHMLSFAPQ